MYITAKFIIVSKRFTFEMSLSLLFSSRTTDVENACRIIIIAAVDNNLDLKLDV